MPGKLIPRAERDLLGGEPQLVAIGLAHDGMAERVHGSKGPLAELLARRRDDL